jgi:hypothetical protein
MANLEWIFFIDFSLVVGRCGTGIRSRLGESNILDVIFVTPDVILFSSDAILAIVSGDIRHRSDEGACA